MVSELLTNALRHAAPKPGPSWARVPVQLGLMQPGACLLCAVLDPSDKLPAPREAGTYDETGRGLQVISSLSDGWGCTAPSPAGKVVWAFFAADLTMANGHAVQARLRAC